MFYCVDIPADITTNNQELYTQGFIQAANAILDQCSSASSTTAAAEEFTVKYPFDIIKYPSDSMLVGHLDNWVRFAVSARTRSLAIDLEPEGLKCCECRYSFPLELFDEQSLSRLEAIRLSVVSLRAPPPGSGGFPNIKSLDLRFVDLSSDDLQLVLSGCFRLERLSIVSCHMHDGELRVPPAPCLRYLLVANSSVNKIQLIAGNLTTFVYDGPMVPLEALELRHAELDFSSLLTLEDAITELPKAIPHAQNLHLIAPMTLEELHLPECAIKFAHLKHLELTLCLYGPGCENNLLSLASFLKAAPLLEGLYINFENSWLPMQVYELPALRSLPPCPHGHLKRLRIGGFCGTLGEIELAAHVADNSPRLESLVIDPVMRQVNDYTCDLTPSGRAKFLGETRDYANIYLAGRVAQQGARLHVLW
ncbi:uncharacterized protein LOC112270558 [Brachypodium distachyon]|uniref:uncharacterized protein LOC112270558 n=1 Tax=Brachypodium distachyon TaxID=15368 RepID=UPI00052FF34E|nr:uncharacterized protein LOC112270558 [Brachypodium distachyon]|eukprot:XP_024314012.1 uncharacterized protein LOC112270558 [Brachypodium distachyon]